MSIITLIIVLFGTIYFFLEVFLRTSFVLIYNQTTDFSPVLNITNFPVGLAIFDSNAIPIENLENQIRIYGEFYELSPDPQGYKITKLKLKQFPLERCDLDKHFGDYKYLFNKIQGLNYYLCLPVNSVNLTLYGNYADGLNPNSFLIFQIAKCFNNNNTDLFPEVKCFNRTTIDNNFNNVYLNMLFLDYDIDHKNSKNPGNIILRSETYPLSTTVYNRYFIRKKIVQYISDFGFLFSSIQNNVFFQDDSLNLNTDLRVNSSPIGLFGQVNISLSKKTDNYYRSYIKLQSALANIGGIVEGIFVIFSLLVKFIMSNNYFIDLGNKSYFFLDEMDKGKISNIHNVNLNRNININNVNNNQIIVENGNNQIR